MIIKETTIRSVVRDSILKEVGFNKLDLGRGNRGRSNSGSDQDAEGDVSQVTGNYPKENIELVVKELKAAGITNPNAIMGVLSVVAKESNFVPKNEKGYSGTSISRIKEVFKKNTIYVDIPSANITKGTKFKNLSDDQIRKLKASDEIFFNALYGGWLGNNNSGDGWKFRGRGFNQLTGRANYRKAGFESNPDAVNNPQGAAKVVAKFMTEFHTNVWSPAQLNSASTPEKGAKMAADINGGRRYKTRARKLALARLDQFKNMFSEQEEDENIT